METKIFEEQGKREQLEQKLANLKNQSQANSNHENGENMQPNSSETPVENQAPENQPRRGDDEF